MKGASDFAPFSFDEERIPRQQDLFTWLDFDFSPKPTFPKAPFDQCVAFALLEGRALCRAHGQTLVSSADLQSHIRNLKTHHHWIISFIDYHQVAVFPNGAPRKRRQRYYYLSDAQRARHIEAVGDYYSLMHSISKPRQTFGVKPSAKMRRLIALAKTKPTEEEEDSDD